MAKNSCCSVAPPLFGFLGLLGGAFGGYELAPDFLGSSDLVERVLVALVFGIVTAVLGTLAGVAIETMSEGSCDEEQDRPSSSRT